jgi:hypothetical protein
MRRILIAAMLMSGVAIAAPANAQYRHGGYQIERQLDQLRDRIHRAEDRDAISKREEDRLLRQARFIDRLHDRYRRNGLTGWEMRDLQNRIHALRQNIRFERRDGDNRRYGYRF